jgi:dGTPase
VPGPAQHEDFAPGLQAPLEGQIVDAADEIAYTSADVDDALAVRWISLEDLSQLTLWKLAWQRVAASDAAAREIHKQIRATKTIVAVLADDLIAQTAANLALPALATRDAVQHAPAKCVCFSPAIAAALEELGSFLLTRVYQHPASLQKSQDARRCIGDLFAHFVEHPETLPGRYLTRVENDGLHRVVCDYIAGMTDRFCLAEHDRLCGQR